MTQLILFRIKVLGPVEVQVSQSKQGGSKKSKKRWSKIFKFSSDEEDGGVGGAKESVELDEGVVGSDGGEAGTDGGMASQEVEPVEEKPRILMVRTENLKHNPFEQTQELKVRISWQCVRERYHYLFRRQFLPKSSKPSEIL